MLECLQEMYRLWKANGGDPDRIVGEYVERVRKGDTELHNQRRRVSFLFQKLAFLYYHRLIPPEFRREWLGFSLEAIAVLMPIETKALPQIVDGPPFPPTLELIGVKSLDFRRMFWLYNEGRRK
jgi:hypothetical protein